MSYGIDRAALLDFVRRKLDVIEALPREASQGAQEGYGSGALGPDELEATWLAAGIATFIGQAIVDEPERFIAPASELAAA